MLVPRGDELTEKLHGEYIAPLQLSVSSMLARTRLVRLSNARDTLLLFYSFPDEYAVAKLYTHDYSHVSL